MLYADVEGPAPAHATLEAYDWESGDWVTQAEKMGAVELQQPARFLRNRELRIRLTLDQSNMMQGGCFNLGASIGGTR
jgi:hypothetical protein